MCAVLSWVPIHSGDFGCLHHQHVFPCLAASRPDEHIVRAITKADGHIPQPTTALPLAPAGVLPLHQQPSEAIAEAAHQQHSEAQTDKQAGRHTATYLCALGMAAAPAATSADLPPG